MSPERARGGGSKNEERGPAAGFLRLAAFALLVFPGATAASEARNPAEAVPIERRTILAWQAALEAAGFSPGLIDGRKGPKGK